MLLQKSFGTFVKQLGAIPYSNGRIEQFSRDHEDSAAFGLGAVVNVETGTVRITIGPRDGLDLSTMTTGVVGLYRILDTREDYLVRQTWFDSTMRRDDGSWVVSFSSLDDVIDLWAACIISLPTGDVSSICEVLTDDSKKPLLLPTQLKTHKDFDTPDPIQTVPTKQIVVLEHELRVATALDFSRANPIVVGLGTLSYSGGGSRYLPSKHGPVLQSLDVPPWKLETPLLLEPAGTNLFSKYDLQSTCWTTTSPNDLLVDESYYTLPGFETRMVGWHIQGTNGLNGSWEVVFDSIDWNGNTTVGSLFAQIDMPVESNCKFELLLRAFEVDGRLRAEATAEIRSNARLTVTSVVFPKPSSETARAGKISLVVRASSIDRSDRFDLILGFPQIEYSGSANSRTIGSRRADLVSFMPSTAIVNPYGQFTLELAPNYTGVPKAAGVQLFLDMRDSNGRNGFWLGHRSDGMLEFGYAGAASAGYDVYVRSASVVQFVENSKCMLAARWDSDRKSLRLDLNGVRMAERSFQVFPTIVDTLKSRFGTKYDGSHAGSFQLLSYKHEHTSE